MIKYIIRQNCHKLINNINKNTGLLNIFVVIVINKQGTIVFIRMKQFVNHFMQRKMALVQKENIELK